MANISQRELCNDNSRIVDRVEAGESFTVTRNGVPVADVVPHRPRRTPGREVSSTAVVETFADLRPLDVDAWLADIRDVSEFLDDSPRDPWESQRG